jgi:hypothetical protein
MLAIFPRFFRAFCSTGYASNVHNSGMDERLTTLERAFQLAKSGDCASVTQIRERLKKEGYSDWQSHTKGPSIRAQLNSLCAQATKAKAEESQA